MKFESMLALFALHGQTTTTLTQRPLLFVVAADITATKFGFSSDYYSRDSSDAGKGKGKEILSVTVRVSAGTGNGPAFRTAPFHVKQLGGKSCSAQWHEGHHSLRIDGSVTNLRCQIYARVDNKKNDDIGVGRTKKAPAAEVGMGAVGAVEAGGTTSAEILLACATLDLNAAREGYNFVQLFSPGRNDVYKDGTGDFSELRNAQGGAVEEEARLMGQLVVKLEWAEVGQEGAEEEEEEARGHTVLVIRGASGLAKPDS